MSKEELIEKIKKLLALADSSNPNEAAVALSRAQKLMEKYDIESTDLAVDKEINEINVDPIKGLNTKNCVSYIVGIIKKAFGVEGLVQCKGSKITKVTFIGSKSILESCEYIFVLLSRSATTALSNYKNIIVLEIILDILNTPDYLLYFKQSSPSLYKFCLVPLLKEKDNLQEYKENCSNPDVLKQIKNFESLIKKQGKEIETLGSFLNSQIKKRKKYFVEGFFQSIYSKVNEYARNTETNERIEKYLAAKYPKVKSIQKRNHSITQAEYDAYLKGQEQGKSLQISSAIQGHAPETKLIK